MAQFLEFGSIFNDYFNIDHRGSAKGESGSESGSKRLLSVRKVKIFTLTVLVYFGSQN